MKQGKKKKMFLKKYFNSLNEIVHKVSFSKNVLTVSLGPDRLELTIFDITDKKFYNHPSRLQL